MNKIKRPNLMIHAMVMSAILGAPVFADAFDEANALYRDAKYEEAAARYEQAAYTAPSAEVYYNLGNAYFKQGKIGPALLNYERARRLAPRDADIQANRSYVNRLIEYQVEDKRSWYWRQLTGALDWVTVSECWLIALTAYFIFMTGFLIALLAGKKPVSGTGRILACSLVLLCFLPIALKASPVGAPRAAIVTGPKAEVRYGPSAADRLAFRLVEGIRIHIQEEREDWYRIELPDTRSGWVPKAQVTPI